MQLYDSMLRSFQAMREGKRLLVAEGENGVCRVVCFSLRHDLTPARMAVKEIRAVVMRGRSSMSNSASEAISTMCRCSRIAAR
jgi:galactose-1-phosphate uridylyltransferase